MTPRAGVAIVVAGLGLAGSRLAIADPHKLMVLQSEGRVDAATRAKIDAAVLKLALATEPQASPGDLNFTDAATAVGCKPEAAACKDEILGMLAVDEIVITTVAPKPGGLELTVRRVGKGGASREASTLLASGAPLDKLDAIAPLFSDAAAQPAPAAPPAASPGLPPAPAVTAGGRPVEEPPVIPAPADVKPPPPSPVTTPAPAARDNPPSVDTPDPGRRRLELIGMASGGGMVMLGLVLWGAASGVQGDIDKAPATTSQDLAHLRDLESKGDTYATLGNVFTIGGLVVGGVSTYFFIRDRRKAAFTATARLTPTVLDHGAGVVLTIGGMP
jgi:hypothetical protein